MKTVIFDFDGTLADSFTMCLEIAYELTDNKSLTDQDKVEELKKGSLADVAKELGVAKHRWPLLIVRGRKIMSGKLDELNAFSGIEKALTDLKKDGFKLYIMSTNSEDNISSFLKRHNLNGYIEEIYGGVGLLGKAGKLKRIIKQNKLRAKDVIYVGDEVRDIEAAKKAGIGVVAVGWGFNDVNRLAEDNPDALVYKRTDLAGAIKSIGDQAA